MTKTGKYLEDLRSKSQAELNEELVAAKKELARLLAIQDEQSAFDDFARVTHEHEQIPGRPGPYDDKLMHFVLIKNEQAVVKRYETQDARPTYTYPMQTLRIGDCAMVNCPWELYLVFGQIIKARTKAPPRTCSSIR